MVHSVTASDIDDDTLTFRVASEVIDQNVVQTGPKTADLLLSFEVDYEVYVDLSSNTPNQTL